MRLVSFLSGVAGLLIVSSITSCGSSPGVCAPGQQIACACPGGAQGAQACNADGAGFAACDCPGSTSSSGTGTASGSSSSTSGAPTSSSSSSSSGGEGTSGSSSSGTGGASSSSTAASSSGTGGASSSSTTSTAASSSGTGGASSSSAASSSGTVGASSSSGGTGPFDDFPALPLQGAGVPDDVGTLFGAPDAFTAGSLCVLEPQLSASGVEGAMIPSNWTRPRFRAQVGAGLDLFEFRLHSPIEANDLVAYTTEAEWYVPSAIWSAFAGRAGGTAVSVTIRAIDTTAPGTPGGVKGDFNIAPVAVTGSLIYWTLSSALLTPQSSPLLGFAVGAEGTARVLNLTTEAWSGEIGEDGAELRGYYDSPKLAGFPDGQVRCLGCHTALPDGQGVVFTDDWPWSKGAAALAAGNAGAIPTYIGQGARSVMKMPWWGSQSMSPAHFTPGDRVLVTSYGTTFKSGLTRTQPWQALPSYNTTNPNLDDKVKWHALAWIDLESNATIDVAVTDTPNYDMSTTPGSLGQREQQGAAAMGSAYGLIATGDTGVSDVSPAVNHRGDTIAYVATDFSPDGHPDYTATTASIRTVAYNKPASGVGPQGGTSQPLAGASDTGHLDYYPSYSADDQFIAFVQAPVPSVSSPDGPYSNRFGQVMIVPAGGGTPTRLAANDPDTCAGDNTAAGILNSSPRWSPDAISVNGKTYYFLIFSSARKYGDEFATQFSIANSPLGSYQGLPISSQLWLTAVVVDDKTGAVTTYPAYYVWNQNRAVLPGGTGAGIQAFNLTPTWDAVQLPPLTIDPVAP